MSDFIQLPRFLFAVMHLIEAMERVGMEESVERPRRRFVTQTVADAVTRELRQRIIIGELADGMPLRQDALAEELGVSRNPVREALNRLESEGLAVSKPYCGYVVTALSADEIRELFDLRALLEPELIRHAIPRMTDRDFERAETILANYAIGLDTADVQHWGELNVAYHMALYEPSGRRRTLEIVRGLLVNTDRYTRLVLTLDEGPADAKDDHSGLLEYCRRRNVSQAVALTRDHIDRASANLLAMFDGAAN
jgi:DNA-binding GntR family transcriptional regulator